MVFSYFAEFFSKRLRGAFIIVLAAFWTVGRLYASLLAWVIVPRDISFYLGSFEVTSWRIFIMLCTIPCFSSAIALIFLPESPGYLFSVSYSIALYTIHVYDMIQRVWNETLPWWKALVAKVSGLGFDSLWLSVFCTFHFHPS